jgi:hypothetical protein
VFRHEASYGSGKLPPCSPVDEFLGLPVDALDGQVHVPAVLSPVQGVGVWVVLEGRADVEPFTRLPPLGSRVLQPVTPHRVELLECRQPHLGALVDVSLGSAKGKHVVPSPVIGLEVLAKDFVDLPERRGPTQRVY